MENIFREIINLRGEDAMDIIKYAMYRRYSAIRVAFREVKWFIQRGKRGYADCDTWDFDTYLSKIICGGCKRLKEGDSSLPFSLSIKYSNYADAEKKWREILTKIIRAFSLKRLWMDECRFPTKSELKEIEVGWRLFKKYYGDLWD
jgi:hypothetical protein